MDPFFPVEDAANFDISFDDQVSRHDHLVYRRSTHSRSLTYCC